MIVSSVLDCHGFSRNPKALGHPPSLSPKLPSLQAQTEYGPGGQSLVSCLVDYIQSVVRYEVESFPDSQATYGRPIYTNPTH